MAIAASWPTARVSVATGDRDDDEHEDVGEEDFDSECLEEGEPGSTGLGSETPGCGEEA